MLLCLHCDQTKFSIGSSTPPNVYSLAFPFSPKALQKVLHDYMVLGKNMVANVTYQEEYHHGKIGGSGEKGSFFIPLFHRYPKVKTTQLRTFSLALISDLSSTR